MADIRLHSFRGKRPYVISEHLLGLSDASDCQDVIFESGLLKGIDDDIVEVAADSNLAVSRTLYQYYTDAWYSFDADVDIVTATKSATDEVIMYTGFGGDSAPAPETRIITEGTSGFYTGYSDGTGAPPVVGSIDIGTIYTGAALRTVSMYGLGPTIQIIIAGNLPSNFLSSIEIVGFETVTQADDLVGYTYNGTDNQTEWSFSIASVHWDGVGNSNVIINYGAGAPDVAGSIAEPRFTNTTLIGAGPAVSAYRTLGITAPTVAPVAATNGALDPDPVYDTRSYVYTWVDSVSGMESAPSPTSNIITVDTVGQTVDLTISTTAPVDGTYNIDKKRIYRTVTGTATTAFQFVAEVNLAATNPVNDAADSLTLGEEIGTTDFERPPLTMQGVTAHPAGFFVGFDGSTMCFSEPGFFYAWPVKYRFELEFPIVGIATIGGYVAVMTEGVPYLISGTSPYNMVPRKLDAYYPCVSKRSIVEMGGYCIYAAEDALVQISPNGAVPVSRGILTREQWQNKTPSSIFGTRWRNLYLAVYPTYIDVWAPQAPEVGITTVNNVYKSTYVRPSTGDTFFVNTSNEIVNFSESLTSAATWSWKSKPFMFDRPVNFACMRAIGSFGGTITIEEDDTAPSVSGDAYSYTTPDNALINNTPIRLPSGIKYKGVRITINGGAGDEIQEVHLATSIAELPGTATPGG